MTGMNTNPLRVRRLAHSTVAAAMLVLPATQASAQPIDVRVARWSQQASLQNSTALDRTLTTAEWLAVPGAITVPALTWATARLTHHDGLSDAALRTEGSVVASAIVTGVLKRTFGRARPYVVHDSDASDFSVGGRTHGGEDYRSFPSGHATQAFAAATAVMLETRRRAPDQLHTVTPIAYGIATLAGGARVYHDKHWLSDVLAGAVIGTVTAHIVDRIPAH